jgi:hypothetical protein
MRYLFWVVLVVILALAGAFYFFTVPPLQTEFGQTRKTVENESQRVLGLAKDTSKLPTERHVLETKKYGEYLKKQEEEIKGLLREKRTVLDPRFDKAPKDPLEFDGWLINVRKEILDEAAKAGLALPATFPAQWLDEGKTTSSLADREPRLNKIALAADVVQLLAAARAPVTVVKFPGDADKPEISEEVKAGVLSLDHLELIPPEKVIERDRQALHAACTAAGVVVEASKSVKADPAYTAMGLDVRFTAPLAVAPLVIQALESNPRWFAIVRKIDTQRVVEPYVKATELGLAAPGGPAPAAPGTGTPVPAPAPTPAPAPAPAVGAGTPAPAAVLSPEDVVRRALLNTRYREAPVQAQVLLDLLTFKTDALKQDAAVEAAGGGGPPRKADAARRVKK